MKQFHGKALHWNWNESVVELTLDRKPANEIGTVMLEELEQFVAACEKYREETSAAIIHGEGSAGFCAGADLRELYERAAPMPPNQRTASVREFLQRIHAVLNYLDSSSFVTIAAVNGICFGGGFELALCCDMIFADKMARFAFPELRLGLIPGFGGIPRLKRDLGNAIVRDLLLTGRTMGAPRAHSAGLVSQLAAEGEVLRIARATAAQITKFDSVTRSVAKKFIKAIPMDELHQEVDLFCELFAREEVLAALKRFVESKDAMPYLPS